MRIASSLTSVQSAQITGRRRWYINSLCGIFIFSLVCLTLTLQTHAAGSAFLVKVLNIPPNRDPGNMVAIRRNIYFNASDPDAGFELWKSDGTSEGATMVKDIYPGTSSSGSYFLTDVHGTLFFSANDGDNGRELWKSDGTPEGTIMVKDIYPGVEGSYPEELVNANGILFFRAYQPDSGWQIWKSDGTPQGTAMVTNHTITNNGSPGSLRSMNGTLFFHSNQGLWRTDGTLAGTHLVKAVVPYELTVVDDTLFFLTTNTSGDNTIDYHLWKSDGTPEGTIIIKDFAASSGGGSLSQFVNVNGDLFFLVYRRSTGMELWRSDGTSAGTTFVREICADTGSPYFSQGTDVNGTLFFTCGSPSVYSLGYELWKSDGTTNGTEVVKTFYRDATRLTIWPLLNVNGTLCLGADDGIYGMELWKSNGTASGTQLVQDIALGDASADPMSFTVGETYMFFTADDGNNGRALWAMPLSALLPPVSSPTPTATPTATIAVPTITPPPTSTPIIKPNTSVRVYLPTLSKGE